MPRCEEAAREGGRLIVFPEAFIGGYPKGASFGTPVGMRKLEGRDAYQRYHGGAIDLDGEEVALLCRDLLTLLPEPGEVAVGDLVGCLAPHGRGDRRGRRARKGGGGGARLRREEPHAACLSGVAHPVC